MMLFLTWILFLSLRYWSRTSAIVCMIPSLFAFYQVITNLCFSSVYTPSENVDVENQTWLSYLRIQRCLNQRMVSRFETQEEFLCFVMKSQTEVELWVTMQDQQQRGCQISRMILPTLPRHFPFGFTGLLKCSVIELRKIHKKKHLDRDRLEVLRKLLQHRILNFTRHVQPG
jgi:hypothetical protein